MKEALFNKIVSLLDLDRNTDYKILDIGCGRGDLLGLVSESTNSRCALAGIDENQDSITSARLNFPQVEFIHEKFTATLPFDANSLDLVLSLDTIECTSNQTALVDEVFRVLKPGGKVLFAHWDWDTQTYNSGHKSIMRKFVAAYSDWQQDWMEAADGQMGRRRWGWFEGSGKFKGSIASFTLLETDFHEGKYGFDRLHDLSILVDSGTIDAEEYETICHEMESLSDQGKYFYSLSSFIYLGNPVKSR